MTYPKLVLNPSSEQRIKKGHLWIYSNEVDTKKTPLKQFSKGDLVAVHSDKDKFMGVASLNPDVLLCGRILTRDSRITINKKYFEKRINQALSLRESYFDKPYYRLIYGDSDFLPGIVVDRFDQYLVLQITTASMENFKDEIVASLQNTLKPKGIVLANDHSARALESLPEYREIIGTVPEQITLIENQTEFLIPREDGQKTGWFYDHRLNRQFLQGFVKNKKVLDVYSYVGAWGLQAAKAGAIDISFVDSSVSALDYLEENAKINNCEDKVSLYQGKASDVLKALIEEKHKYDVVILDPPGFIKRKKDIRSGETAYHQMNSLALRLLENNGLFVSCSCSMHLPQDKLTDIVRGASMHIDRNSQMIFSGGQGPDHPIHPAIPETAYLKAQMFKVSMKY